MRMVAILAAMLCGLMSPFSTRAQDKPQKNIKKEPAAVINTDPHNIYASGLYEEVIIDANLRIYKVRKYKGIVPSRDENLLKVNHAESGRHSKVEIVRIGFEQRDLFSRVFVLADAEISPWVYDNFVQASSEPGTPYQIFVEIANAKIPRKNDKRPLLTKNFNTPVLSIKGTRMKDGVRVVITLKREARYLPVQMGKVIYVDVEK